MTNYSHATMNKIDRRNFLIGRIEEANYWIDYYGSLKHKSKYAKTRLEDAKRSRDKTMQELKELWSRST